MDRRPKVTTQRGPRRPAAPKPYDIIALEGIPRRAEPEGHHSKRPDSKTGKLTCRIEALTPLHVGSGLFEVIGGEPHKGLAKSDGRPIIPGSSLKGVVRSVAEAISDSCVAKAGGEVRRNLPKAEQRECGDAKKGNPLCVACRIFGAMGYLGRVLFSDARLISGTIGSYRLLPLYRPRKEFQGYQGPDGKFKGRKFYKHGKPTVTGREPWEAIQPGGTFEFHLDFENHTPEELCLLLMSMGAFGNLTLKVGGSKPECLGSVNTSLMKLELESDESYMAFDRVVQRIEGKALEGFLSNLRRNHGGLIRQSSLDALQRIWAYPPQEECPSVPY